MSQSSILIWIFSLTVACVFQSTLTSARFVSVEELKADIKSRDIDRIDKSLNEVKRMSYQGQVLPLMLDLWEVKKENHPDLPWDIITSEIVRVEVANVLIQASINGKIDLDRKALHQYVSGLVANRDIAVAARAIGTLAVTDDPRDVPKILAIAKSMRQGIFHTAVITLTNMCNEDAAKAVEDLGVHVTEKELHSFVIETKKTAEAFKKKTGRCKQNRGLPH
jgi:hypothetical protein